jgi:N-acetylglucosamine-6-sulfatase
MVGESANHGTRGRGRSPLKRIRITCILENWFFFRNSGVVKNALAVLVCTLALPCVSTTAAQRLPNLIVILSDDHRYDFMSCVSNAPAFLETPHLDRLAREGARMANAFVTTSLCSPSRASILTGQYMHQHGVVDNQRAIPAGTTFFPERLQRAGYRTAFLGKWHMGHDTDDPQKGFDHWASFRGQGEYFDPQLNVNGTRRKFTGYTADVLTDLALEWLKAQRDRPFYLQLAHKSVHFDFQPAPRHRGRYDRFPVKRPVTMANTEANYAAQPHWMQERRYSIHGVDHLETGMFDNDPVPNFDNLVRRYCETVYSLDENIGRVLKYLDDSGLATNTMVLYLSDNGFELGEHGFYDKRDATEESIRIPMLAWAPGRIPAGTVVTQMVLNLDVAPTLLEVAGVTAPEMKLVGRSFWPLLEGRPVPWRDHLLYEYYWEWNFPATPSLLAIRTDRYKFVFYHGVWDRNAFYDLATDPQERHNLIDVPAFQDLIAGLQKQLFDELEAGGGLQIPVRPPAGERLDDRKLR